MKEEKTLLAVLPHPDDELFGLGGTLALCVAQGIRVVSVYATRGEVGEIAEGASATPETLGQVREQELRCSAHILGIDEIIFLDYRDSGMAGTPDNGDPRAYMNAPAGEVVGKLVGIIRQVRPQVIITCDPNGTYGHPDHIAVHQHTLAAFEAAGDSGRYPDQGQVWSPDRVFYYVFPQSVMTNLIDRLIELGIDISDFDDNDGQELEGWPDELIDLSLDVSSTVHTTMEAFNCHQTQFGQENFLFQFPESELKKVLSREYFALGRPESTDKTQLDDLFAESA